MQGVVRTFLLVGGIAACHTSDPALPDSGLLSGVGSNLHEGLEVRWSAQLPGSVSSDITVSSLLFRIASLRVIGDAGPGDNRTSADSLDVQWSVDGGPQPITFADAPTKQNTHNTNHADGNL